MKTSDKISFGALLVALVSLSLAWISTVKSCKSSDELQKTNERITAIEYRPRIRFYNPIVTSIQLNIDSLPPKTTTNIKDSIGDVEAQITLKLRLSYKNIGNSTAKMIAFYLTDTISEKQSIKDIMFSPSKVLFNKNDKIKIPHSLEELTFLDTSYIEIERKIMYISNNRFTIHLLAYYQNELGDYYDTYYWINFKTSTLLIPNPEYSEEEFKKFIQNHSNEIVKVAELYDENNYSTVYTEEESLKLINLFDN
ncbi:MAG: hypothetical protein JXB49_04820 [Bacteroidales bacterium]|nr:hypothetical protein [Bacteroidales bacterium]